MVFKLLVQFGFFFSFRSGQDICATIGCQKLGGVQIKAKVQLYAHLYHTRAKHCLYLNSWKESHKPRSALFLNHVSKSLWKLKAQPLLIDRNWTIWSAEESYENEMISLAANWIQLIKCSAYFSPISCHKWVIFCSHIGIQKPSARSSGSLFWQFEASFACANDLMIVCH
jgi:hypothetical protein